MGKPMALNLLKAGVDIIGNDNDECVLQKIREQGICIGELSQIGKECDIIFTILPNGEAVKKVIFGDNGLNLNGTKKQVICDMSSVTPEESRYCYNRLAKLGVGFVDAPVSGGEPKAIDGTLAFMAGGDKESYEILMPYFKIMGDNAVLVGRAGSGSVAKLANQIIVNLTITAVSEAFVLAKKAGADLPKVYEAIRGGLAGSEVLEAKIPMILERNFTPGGKISINYKDIKNVLETAKNQNVPLPFTAQLFQVMQALIVSECMEDDHCAIVKFFENLAGVEIN